MITCALQMKLCFRPTVALQYVAEVRTPLAPLLCIRLELLELGHSARHPQVGRALTSIARSMRQGEVVLFVRPLIRQWDNVVNVQLALMEDEIDGVVTDKALSP